MSFGAGQSPVPQSTVPKSGTGFRNKTALDKESTSLVPHPTERLIRASTRVRKIG